MKNRKVVASRWLLGAGALLSAGALRLCAADLGYQDTPLLPGGKWHVHDGTRPQPKVITPGAFDGIIPPPSDAIVLFDGKGLSKWQDSGGADSGWVLENGAMMVPPKNTPHGGDIQTRDKFGDMQLHIEWAAPKEVKGNSQGRGNSGIFLMGLYELQVMDAYDNPTYPDGQAGAIYGQTPPLVNASRPPGEWQMYDVAWQAPRFDGAKLLSPAYITVFHNGVLVQNHTPLIGPTAHKQLAHYSPQPATGPIRLQDHGNPDRFRNIWVRPLDLPAPLEVPEMAAALAAK